jgi:hypothetical protein
MRRGTILGVLLACLLWGGVTQANAGGNEVRYSGKSGQGRKVALRTDQHGELKRFSIQFRAECGRGFLDHAIQRFVRPLDHADPNGFRDSGTYEFRYEKGRTGEIRTRLRGERVGADRFKGSFTWKGKFFTAGGEKITTCRTAEIHWSASR